MVPIHAIFGVITFMLAIATAVTGLTEKAIYELGYVWCDILLIRYDSN